MRSPLAIVFLAVMMSVAMPVCYVHAYGGGGGGGGGSDRSSAEDYESFIEDDSGTQYTSFVQMESFPLGIGCGWGVGIMGPQTVIGAGINPSDSGGTIEDSPSTSKDAETALNELRDKFEEGSMSAQDVKQDLEWGQQMGVYTSEQSQALLQDLNIERGPGPQSSQQQSSAAPPTRQHSTAAPPVRQQSPAAPPAPQKTKFEQDEEKIDFILSMLLDYDDASPFFVEGPHDLTYWTIKGLYLRGRYLKGAYRDDEKKKAAQARMKHYNDMYRKIKRAADRDYNSR